MERVTPKVANIPYDPREQCDLCGHVGAFDVTGGERSGEYVCEECLAEYLEDVDDQKGPYDRS